MPVLSHSCPQCGEAVSTLGAVCAACAPAPVAPTHRAGAFEPDGDMATLAAAPGEVSAPSAQAPADTEFGPHLLSHYDVLRVLGEGGMGRVHLAHHRALDRNVAIKTIHGLDKAARARFLREGQALARLSHPNVVQVHDAGEDGHLPYLVCEFVDGESLGSRIRRFPALTLADSLRIFAQLLSGLEHAHERGVCHRDLKPDNILLSGDGTAKVADFGLAHLRETTPAAGLTRSGTLMGTPAYMSPEQARGEKTGPATDIYAAGVILFELVAGRVPFVAPSYPEVLVGHINTPAPDPRQFRADVPAGVVDVVMKALAKNPADRWPTAGAFAEALGKINQVPEKPAPSAAISPVAGPAVVGDGRGRMQVALAAVAVLTLGGLLLKAGHRTAHVGTAVSHAPGSPAFTTDLTQPTPALPGNFRAAVEVLRFPVRPTPEPSRWLWVDPTATAPVDGSAAHPYKQLAAALAAVKAGEAIKLKAGQYAVGGPEMEFGLTVTVNGLRIEAETPGTAVFTPAGETKNGVWLKADDVVLAGCVFKDFPGSAVVVGRVETPQQRAIVADVRVVNCHEGLVTCAGADRTSRPLVVGLLAGGLRFSGTASPIRLGEGPVEDAHLVDIDVDMMQAKVDDAGSFAIEVQTGFNVLLERCVIHDAPKGGIGISAQRILVSGCRVGPCAQGGIRIGRGGDVVNTSIFKTGGDGAMVFEHGGAYRVIHCLVALHARDADGYAATAGVDHRDEPVELSIVNSIFQQNAGALWISKSTKLTLNGTLLAKGRNGAALVVEKTEGEETIDTLSGLKRFTTGNVLDPAISAHFADAERADFRLLPGPGVGQGVMDGIPTVDAAGVTRPQGAAPDLGPTESKR
jgi:hypothetical protein